MNTGAFSVAVATSYTVVFVARNDTGPVANFRTLPMEITLVIGLYRRSTSRVAAGNGICTAGRQGMLAQLLTLRRICWPLCVQRRVLRRSSLTVSKSDQRRWAPTLLMVSQSGAGSLLRGTLANGPIAMFGIYEGDITADGSWSDMTAWVDSHYGITQP